MTEIIVADEKMDDLLGMSVRDFAAATAGKTPTPGGGSVAGVVAALGVALGEMSLNFTRGKKKFAEHEEYYSALGKRLARARGMFEDLLADDVIAYKLYQAAMKQQDSPEKDQAVQLATAAAINVPREMMKLALAMLVDFKTFAEKVNPWLVTDLMAAGVLAAAAVRLSDYNVRVNVPNLSDKSDAEEVKSSSAADLVKADELLAEIEDLGSAYLT